MGRLTRHKNKIIIVVLVASFFAGLSVPVSADGISPKTRDEGVFSCGGNTYTHTLLDSAGNSLISWDYFDSQYEDLLGQMREAMKGRDDRITVTYRMSDDIYDADEYAIALELVYDAGVHTGDPGGGDYIYHNISHLDIESNVYEDNGADNMTITYQVDWRSTNEQEQAVSAEVNRLLSSFGWTDETSDYDKISDIYMYLTSTVAYDYAGYNNEIATGQDCHVAHSAYGALINHEAICEGIAAAFYRLSLEAGINCRCITGTTKGGSHVWNIVELNGVYYNVDVTLDLGNGSYEYFLKSDGSFSSTHTRAAAYAGDIFYSLYPMAGTDYQSAEEKQHINTIEEPVNETEETVEQKEGKEQVAYTGFSKNKDGIWYIEDGAVTFKKNGVIQDTDGAVGKKGTWYYVVRSKVQNDYTGLSEFENDNGFWYINKGVVDFTHNGIAGNKNGWYYVSCGKAQPDFTGFVKDNGWWRVKNGKVDLTVSSINKPMAGAWYVRDGKTAFWAAGFTNYRNSAKLWGVSNGEIGPIVPTCKKTGLVNTKAGIVKPFHIMICKAFCHKEIFGKDQQSERTVERQWFLSHSIYKRRT